MLTSMEVKGAFGGINFVDMGVYIQAEIQGFFDWCSDADGRWWMWIEGCSDRWSWLTQGL